MSGDITGTQNATVLSAIVEFRWMPVQPLRLQEIIYVTTERLGFYLRAAAVEQLRMFQDRDQFNQLVERRRPFQ